MNFILLLKPMDSVNRLDEVVKFVSHAKKDRIRTMALEIAP